MERVTSLDLLYVLVLVITFTGVLASALGIRYLIVSRRDRFRERLGRRIDLAPATARSASAVDLGQRERSVWEAALAPLSRVARPTDARELGQLRARLSQAGLRGERALIVYLGTKVVLAAVFAGVYLWVDTRWPLPAMWAALCTIASTAAGFYLPSLWLAARGSERRRAIGHALPNALDLLVTCVEAGLGLESAIQRVASELRLSAPLLAHELEQTELEIRAGISRGDAFRRMADRTGVEELRNLSAIIIQTQIFGTSIAKSLRIQSESMRVRRMQLAEERAAAASVKMTVPLVLCIAPALFAVLIGPAAVKFVRELLPTLGGGG